MYKFDIFLIEPFLVSKLFNKIYNIIKFTIVIYYDTYK